LKGGGKYIKYGNFSWPVLEVALSISTLEFYFLYLVKERIETKETAINAESKKNVSWKDPFGSSADHDVANRRYLINMQLNSVITTSVCVTPRLVIALHILWYQTNSPQGTCCFALLNTTPRRACTSDVSTLTVIGSCIIFQEVDCFENSTVSSPFEKASPLQTLRWLYKFQAWKYDGSNGNSLWA